MDLTQSFTYTISKLSFPFLKLVEMISEDINSNQLQRLRRYYAIEEGSTLDPVLSPLSLTDLVLLVPTVFFCSQELLFLAHELHFLAHCTSIYCAGPPFSCSLPMFSLLHCHYLSLNTIISLVHRIDTPLRFASLSFSQEHKTLTWRSREEDQRPIRTGRVL